MARRRKDNAGPCVTCGTQCVADADGGSVICPNCEWKEQAKLLLAALNDLGTQDLYTDVPEYENRAGAMHDLCALAGELAKGGLVSGTEIEEAARATDSGGEEGEEDFDEDDCDCLDRSWYGDWHDTACKLAGRPR